MWISAAKLGTETQEILEFTCAWFIGLFHDEDICRVYSGFRDLEPLMLASGTETHLMFGKISAVQWVPGNHSPSIQ